MRSLILSQDSEVVLYCNDDLVDANRYLMIKSTQPGENKRAIGELDYKLCQRLQAVSGSSMKINPEESVSHLVTFSVRDD